MLDDSRLSVGDDSYEQIEKGQFPESHNGSKLDVDGEEAGKLE